MSVIQNRLASADLLGLRKRPVQVKRSATIAGSLNNANFCIRHYERYAKLPSLKFLTCDDVLEKPGLA
jgi:hypothetical protein